MNAKVYLFTFLIQKVAMFCRHQQDTFICFNEFFEDKFLSTASTLKLYDSYINLATFKASFPNVRVVYVNGIYTMETCRQLSGHVRIRGCRGKYAEAYSYALNNLG